MINRKLIGISAVILLYISVRAQQQVSIDEATNAAIQTLNLRQNEGFIRNKINVKKVNARKNESNQTLMYEVIFDDGQGVLLSGTKACLPVLGYYTLSNDNSIFDGDAPFCTVIRYFFVNGNFISFTWTGEAKNLQLMPKILPKNLNTFFQSITIP